MITYMKSDYKKFYLYIHPWLQQEYAGLFAWRLKVHHCLPKNIYFYIW